MSQLVQLLSDRVVGTVESVTTDSISVLLDLDAPFSTALNTGTPTGFPRLNGYLLLPNETGATVAWITAIKIDHRSFPKRKGMQDFGLVDLPYPSRIATLAPLGSLSADVTKEGTLVFKMARGVDVFPNVGDTAILPTVDQLKAIVEGEQGVNSGRILLGTCPTAADAEVFVDPNKLFGRHLAVLGNTGSGKSCTVAGLVRWGLQSAIQNLNPDSAIGNSNARFIVLDPNGEYSEAFHDLSALVYRVELTSESGTQLQVPAWLWNGSEWAAFAQASPKVQRPILMEALRLLKAGRPVEEEPVSQLTRHVRAYLLTFNESRDKHYFLNFPGTLSMPTKYQACQMQFTELSHYQFEQQPGISQLVQEIVESCGAAYQEVFDLKGYHKPTPKRMIDRVIAALDELASLLGVVDSPPVDEDDPLPFDLDQLIPAVEAIAAHSQVRDMAQFTDALALRLRSLIKKSRLESVVNPSPSNELSLDQWLERFLGTSNPSEGERLPDYSLAVIDLSLAPFDVIHILVTVISRLVFEALQRYRRKTGKALPTVLILDEAHLFANRSLTNDEDRPSGGACAEVLERIAREGRKFGLGLVLASQRPSELSPTVLSQCNTFILHRLVNDRDQDLVHKLVPDGLRALLRELPSLPSRRAILVGWAAPAPVLVEVTELAKTDRPHSPDPEFWKVWTRRYADEEYQSDWKPIALEWQHRSSVSPDADETN